MYPKLASNSHVPSTSRVLLLLFSFDYYFITFIFIIYFYYFYYFLFLFLLLFLLFIYLWRAYGGTSCHGMHIEIKAQIVNASFPLPDESQR